MSKRYRSVYNSSIWEGTDPELTHTLKGLRIEYEHKHELRTVPKFVNHLIGLKVSPELRLRLFRHVLDHRILMSFSSYGTKGPKEYQRLSAEYRRLFDEWWKDQTNSIAASFPSPKERVTKLKKMRSQLPQKLHFVGPLVTDFHLALDVLIQQTEFQTTVALISPKGRKPTTEGATGRKREKAVTTETGPESGVSRMPIHWTGEGNLLMDLFETFGKLKLISPSSADRRVSHIVAHFVDKNGKPFKPKSLVESDRVTKTNKTPQHRGRPRQGPILEAEIGRLIEIRRESAEKD